MNILTKEELTSLRRTLRDFGMKEIRPRVRELEEAGEFPRAMVKQLGDLGVFGCVFPEAVGGTGLGYRALAAASEEVAYAYPPLSSSLNAQAATVPLTIARWGTTELIDKYVPGLIAGDLIGYNAMTEADGGSDFLGSMKSTARREGDTYVINGAKMWITNGNVADVGVVYVKTDKDAGHQGVSAFVVETSTPGYSASRVKCSGLGNLMPTTALTFDEMRVPASNLLGQVGEGFKIAMTALDFGRLTVAARSVGLAQACLDHALDYCQTREAFGQRIGEFQMVKERLANMVVEVTAARHLVERAAELYDEGTMATREATHAKYFAAEACNRAAQATAEIFGGAAFSDEYLISTFVNYAKLWQTGEGSANIQRVLIADDALDWRRMDRHPASSRVLL